MPILLNNYKHMSTPVQQFCTYVCMGRSNTTLSDEETCVSTCNAMWDHISHGADGTKNITASGTLTGKQLHLTQTLEANDVNRGKCAIAPITFHPSWNSGGDYAFITDSKNYTKGEYWVENDLSCVD